MFNAKGMYFETIFKNHMGKYQYHYYLTTDKILYNYTRQLTPYVACNSKYQSKNTLLKNIQHRKNESYKPVLFTSKKYLYLSPRYSTVNLLYIYQQFRGYVPFKIRLKLLKTNN